MAETRPEVNEAATESACGMAVGDVAGDGKLDFGARFGPAEELEGSADAVGALAHPDKSPMAFASGTHDLGIDTDAVVAEEDVEVAGSVLNLDLDACGAGMKECVDDGLAADAADLVENDGMKNAGLSLHNDAEGWVGCVGLRRQVLRNPGVELFEGESATAVGAQAAKGVAAFLVNLLHEGKDVIE